AEIETEKATMEFEAVDEGKIAKILVGDGTEGVKVGTVIALIAGEGEETQPAKASPAPAAKPSPAPAAKAPAPEPAAKPAPAPRADPLPQNRDEGDRIKASPLARRLAQQRGIDLVGMAGSGPGGRIVKADLGGGKKATPAPAQAAAAQTPSVSTPPAAAAPAESAIPHETIKLSNMRKTIARRL